MPLNPVGALFLAVFLIVGLAIFLYGARDLRVVYHVLRATPRRRLHPPESPRPGRN